MTTTTIFPLKLKSPAEIRNPATGAIDHGLLLVHAITGEPRNYLHEVSIESSNKEGRALLNDAGYRLLCGYRKDGKQWWTYSKQFPLSVADWKS